MIVYTVIIDNYDKLKIPKIKGNKDLRLVCFSDCIDKNPYWEILPVEKLEDETKTARYYKINSHKFFDDDIIIFLDGKYQILGDVVELSKKLIHGYNIALRKHDDRDCIYAEKDYMVSDKRRIYDNPSIMDNQMKIYKDEGFPEHFGLNNTSFIIRRNNNDVKKFNELWWYNVSNYSKRDQLSFDYVRWKTGIKVNSFSKSFLKGYLLKYPHFKNPYEKFDSNNYNR